MGDNSCTSEVSHTYYLVTSLSEEIHKKTNMYNQDSNSWSTTVPETTNMSSDVDQDTVMSLRQRLKTMKEIFGDEIDATESAKRKRAARRRNGNCIDNLIDGSFMGMVLAMCLIMVLGAAFFAYKNLYFAVIKKIYPEGRSEL